MNKLKNISAFLLLFTAVLFTSCSGDIEPYEGTIPGAASNSTPAANTFTAKLDGVNYVATNITGIKASGFISVIATRGSVENIGISIAENATAGSTFHVTAIGSNGRCQYIANSAPEGIFGGDGIMTIISHDTANRRIKGTFSFTATSLIGPTVNHAITEGTFDVTYL